MSEFKLNISEEGLQSAMSEAILLSLGDEGKNAIIKEAVEFLGKRAEERYGQKGTSPIIESFRNAARKVCDEVVLEVVQKDEKMRVMIKEIAEKALTEILTQEYQPLVSKLSAVLRGEILKDR